MPDDTLSDDDALIIHDGRQSPTAAGIQRGTSRLLRQFGFAVVPELVLASGRRVDLMAVNDRGVIWIIEIKSSEADFRADNKWHEYNDYCDRLYFAAPGTMNVDILPQQAGLILADAWGAEIMRHAPDERLNAARRKAVTLRFARTAALRLQQQFDPKAF